MVLPPRHARSAFPRLFRFFLLLCVALLNLHSAPAGDLPGVRMGDAGKLVYTPDADGNRIPDFSHAGYGGGGVALPEVAVKATLAPVAGDNRARIQAAIDEVSALPADANGFRGAVLLQRGVFEVGGPLLIRTSGLVLRGEGREEKTGTTLLATGTQQEVFLKICGEGTHQLEKTERLFDEDFVPCGANSVTLTDTAGLAVGDRVLVRRYATAEWLSVVGMDRIPPNMRRGPDGNMYDSTKQWTPSYWESYDRTITAIDGGKVTLDAGLPSAFGPKSGRGSLAKYQFPGRISGVGIENFRVVSRWQAKPLEEIRQLNLLNHSLLSGDLTPRDGERFDDLRHPNAFCEMDAVENAWARNLTIVDFYDYAILVGKSGKSITIEDCTSILPAPEFYRIYTYVGRSNFNLGGQMILVQRSLGVNNRHTFAVSSRAGGPNVFLDCDAQNALASSETHHRWSTGVLFDSLGTRHPTSLQLINRGNLGSGQGWAGANSIMWNCRGGTINAQVPPTAFNIAIGCQGITDESLALPEPPAYVSWGAPVTPRSLYLQQLRERLGEKAVRNIAADSQL